MDNLIQLELDLTNNKLEGEIFEINDFIFSHNLKHLKISF